MLLVAFADWSAGRVGTKSQWVRFLTLLDVADGLRPVVGRLQDSGLGWRWNSLVRGGDSKEALDEDWCSEASLVSFRHPYTEYRRRGKAWRLPGQIEHGKLSESAKEVFQDLAFKHLETHKAEYLTFDVGRFARPRRDWDRRTLPTPLATFLRSKAWIAAGTDEKPGFRKTSECWGSRKRQDRPPRFLERVSDTVAGLVEGSEELAELVFGPLGLREWHGPDTAPERLRALAVVAPALATHDRQRFRREYRRAWLDLSNTDVKRHSKLTPWRHPKLTPEETAYIAPQRRIPWSTADCAPGPPGDGGLWSAARSNPGRSLRPRSSSWTAGTPRPGRAARPITAIRAAGRGACHPTGP